MLKTKKFLTAVSKVYQTALKVHKQCEESYRVYRLAVRVPAQTDSKIQRQTNEKLLEITLFDHRTGITKKKQHIHITFQTNK